MLMSPEGFSSESLELLLPVLARIDRNLARADGMLQDLLDASQIKSGKLISIQATDCDPCKIARKVLDELSALHGPRFQLETGDVGPTADPAGLRRIIENLASNAVKYGAPDAPVRNCLGKHADQFELRVENRGNPIPAEEQRHILTLPPGGLRHAERAEGLGPGAPARARLAQAHRGEVTVRSSAEGTCFTVTLPLRQLPPQ